MVNEAQSDSKAQFLERLRSYEGRQVAPPLLADDPVNQPMIRHFVQALDDRNPIYVDDAAARATGRSGVVAPPAMLNAWTLPGMEGLRRTNDDGHLLFEIFDVLAQEGFSAGVATNSEQQYFRELQPGDHISMEMVIDSVSEEKLTGRGRGHFVTTKDTYTDQNGEVVGVQLFRMLRYEPITKAAESLTARPGPSLTMDNEFWFEAAQERKLLIQKCAACGQIRHPPSPSCPNCLSFDWTTIESVGKGSVHSFVVVHHPQVAGFEYPLVVALIDLDEGTRFISNLVGIAKEDVVVGMPVEVEWHEFADGLTLPLFRPAGG